MIDFVPVSRRIITIDDNEHVHNDFRAILSPRPRASALDALEQELFGAGARPEEEEQVKYEVDSALQGEEGVEKIRQARSAGQPFAVAFVDMRMPPGWDGLETTRRIWEVDREVQIVICTAYSDYSSEELAHQFRRTDNLLILKKPFEAVEILQLANALTEKWVLSRQALLRLNEMRALVHQRTQELETANAELLVEIERRREKEVELQRLSRLDALTGVANRRVFDEILKEEFTLAASLGKPISLIMLDLDHFKQYNDHYGHLAGDQCLRRISEAISLIPMRPRNLFARYGGEEFAFILPETRQNGARIVAGRVLSAVEALQIPHARSTTGGVMTASAGVATATPGEDSAIDILVSSADQALYRAKEAGRNRVSVSSEAAP